MDMSDIFKRHFVTLHKATNVGKTVQDRKEDLMKERKSRRESLVYARRNIDVNMSPYLTPLLDQAPQKTLLKKDSATKSTANDCRKRLELLAKWKADKAKQKQLELATKKPLFKVYHVSPDLGVNLEHVNKLIKGKAILTAAMKKSQFAPDNHTFRPPNGIKPINLMGSKIPSKVPDNMEPTGSKPYKTIATPSSSKTPSKPKYPPTGIESGHRKIPKLLKRQPPKDKVEQSIEPTVPQTNSATSIKYSEKFKRNNSCVTPKFPSIINRNKQTPTVTSANRDKQTSSVTSFSHEKRTPGIAFGSQYKTPKGAFGSENKKTFKESSSGRNIETPSTSGSSQSLATSTTLSMKKWVRSKPTDQRESKSRKPTRKCIENNSKGSKKSPKKSAKCKVSEEDIESLSEAPGELEGRKKVDIGVEKVNGDINSLSKQTSKEAFDSENKQTSEFASVDLDIETPITSSSQSTAMSTGHKEASPSTFAEKSKYMPAGQKKTNSRKHTRKFMENNLKGFRKSLKKSAKRKVSEEHNESLSKTPEELEDKKEDGISVAVVSDDTNSPYKQTSKEVFDSENKQTPEVASVDLGVETPSASSSQSTPILTAQELATHSTSAGKKKAKSAGQKKSKSRKPTRKSAKRRVSEEIVHSLSKTPEPLENKKKDVSSLETMSDDLTENHQIAPVYISPFVTISRGKRNARDEYHIRRSSCGTENMKSQTPEEAGHFSMYTSPEAGAEYFMVKLDAEIERINKICEKWDELLQSPELPEEAHSSIDVAIGQSKLLITKKFQQFRGLIMQCKTKNYDEKIITCEDLHGFWDMIYMQVEDLDKRFANLDRLKENDWTEMIPERKAPVKKRKVNTKRTNATSTLKDMIKAARKKQKDKNLLVEDEKVFDGGCFEIKTPLKEQVPETVIASTNGKRTSLRVSILTSQSKKRCSSSPGLMVMKISQSIKQGNGLTPARSILKMDGSKSTGKKSVKFKESLSPRNLKQIVLFTEEDKENTPRTMRRSSRLALAK